MRTTPYTNDGTDAAPRLEVFLNLGTLGDLPEWSAAPRGSAAEVYAALREAGFTGIQGGDAGAAAKAGLRYAGSWRVNAVGEAEPMIKDQKAQGAVAGTLHVLWGVEDDDEVDRVIGDILEQSAKHDLPIYVETHRSTCTQDWWRTAQLVRRHPGLKINGDFSHWYTGLEMPYASLDRVMPLIEPVLDRVGFMHGRIGNPSSMQVDIGATAEEAKQRPYVQHFLQIWSRVFAGFKKQAGPGDYLVFAPEILPSGIYYARVFPGPDGQPREESDRWQQALLYKELVEEAFAGA